MDEYEQIIATIASQTGTRFRPASSTALTRLRQFNLPESVTRFYARYEPEQCAEGQVRLWPILDMVGENTEYGPGAYVSPFGYIVFASTIYGDGYCFNLNEVVNGQPEIVLISHEVLGEGTTADMAATFAKRVAGTLREFLEQFSQGTVDEECIY